MSTIWAFDLGKGSIGEAVWNVGKKQFDNVASLLIPAKDDTTCYTSCLLRIKLLRGEKLEHWQIYKALHSAIQKRGYGRVPWTAREVGRKELIEEKTRTRTHQTGSRPRKKGPALSQGYRGSGLFQRGRAREAVSLLLLLGCEAVEALEA